MQAAHKNNEPTNFHNGPTNFRTSIGESLKAWVPVVVTAIIVPGGIVIAVAILVRRWYRNRAVRPATFA